MIRSILFTDTLVSICWVSFQPICVLAQNIAADVSPAIALSVFFAILPFTNVFVPIGRGIGAKTTSPTSTSIPIICWTARTRRQTPPLLEAGCTPEEVKSITGHKTTQMIDKYAIGVRQERIAKQVQNIWGK